MTWKRLEALGNTYGLQESGKKRRKDQRAKRSKSARGVEKKAYNKRGSKNGPVRCIDPSEYKAADPTADTSPSVDFKKKLPF